MEHSRQSKEMMYVKHTHTRGGTNERPGTDHVTWGPMRGLEKNCTYVTNKRTDMATLWLNRPSGRFSKNHKEECQTNYHSEKLEQDFPEANQMVCEQTFAWLGRFKKVLNSTPKTHYHFIMHRLIVTRNRYTEHCYRENCRPLLPSAKMLTKQK